MKSEQDPTDNKTEVKVNEIILPSGRSIETVRFFNNDPEHKGLDCCPACDSNLVQSIGWEETKDTEKPWHLILECPNCFDIRDDHFTTDEARDLEDKLDEGDDQFDSDLREWTRQNMGPEVMRFIEALYRNHILPEDF